MKIKKECEKCKENKYCIRYAESLLRIEPMEETK